MSQWLRWHFVLPRLLLCVVAGLAAQFTADLIVRAIAIQSATRLVGAPVDVTNARISLKDGHIHLGGLSIGDPRCPNQPCLAADSCEVKLDFGPMTRKQTIIKKARLSGVRLSAQAPATDTAFQDAESDSVESAPAKFYDVALADSASDQLARINAHFEEDQIADLDSIKRATALQVRLPAEMAVLENRSAELQRQAEELEKVLAAANMNQLRHDRAVEGISGKAADLRKELDSLAVEFDQLPQRLENERRKVIAARRTDEQQLVARLRIESVDANALNTYLLGDQVTRPLNDAISWLKCVDQLASSTRRRTLARRGEDIIFTGLRPAPSFLIRTLEVQGAATIAGQAIPVQGQITNLTTTPALIGEPTCARFTSSGDTSIEVRATFNHSNGRDCDEVFVECREIPWSAESLGRAEQLQVQLSPSKASLLVSLQIRNGRLSGNVQLVRKDVVISTKAAGKLSDLSLSELLNASLRNVESFATRITIDGTVDRPHCAVWSNLGPAVVEGVDRAVAKHAEQHTRTVLAEARRVVDERLATLERQVSDQQTEFARFAAGMPTRLEQVARHQTRRERIAVERIGRRLPDNSILR
jgi:uncharacterized protein (TIGR03545 family)